MIFSPVYNKKICRFKFNLEKVTHIQVHVNEIGVHQLDARTVLHIRRALRGDTPIRMHTFGHVRQPNTTISISYNEKILYIMG